MINGVAAVPIMIVMMLMTNNKNITGGLKTARFSAGDRMDSYRRDVRGRSKYDRYDDMGGGFSTNSIIAAAVSPGLSSGT